MGKKLKINNLKDKVFTLILLVIVVGVLVIFDVNCIFYTVFHIPCPSCGMTRAWTNLLHLDIAGAFGMHFMFWSVPILFLYYIFDGKLFKVKWLDNAVIIGIGVGFLVNWIIRLCIGGV